MIFAIYDGAGVILRKGDVPEDDIPNYAQAGEHIYKGDCEYEDLIDVATGEVIPNGMGPRPGPSYLWDSTARKWAQPSATQRATLKAAIEAERDRRVFAPINLTEGTFDADARSQQNLADKLASITSREQLGMSPMSPQMCVWRDSSNVTHSFADQPTYKAWLATFAIALADRGTAAYAWSWQKKADLDALSDDALSGFDPTN
jgi:hypothetical protein